MEYFEGNLCISVRDLVDGGIMSKSCYAKQAERGRLRVVRQGKGMGNYALVAVDSLPEEYLAAVKRKYPNGRYTRLVGWIKSQYEVDAQAMCYFHSQERSGVALSGAKVQEYVTNASVLNCCLKLYDRAAIAQKLMGNRYNWDMMAETIAILKQEYGHTLPESTLRFRKKAMEYRKYGYGSLISGKFGNQSARKVDFKTERLVCSLAVLPNKPYNSNVYEMYNMFVCGELEEVYDVQTGELFSPDDFVNKRTGEPLALSETTICNILNKPKNRVLIEHALSSWTTFMHEQMPHVHRHAPEFSFSKISLDDRDLPRKLKDTKARPKAYYAYDVASQCVVGYAYNRNKNVDLVVECFRNMLRLIERKGWGCPAQVEVENHLMTQWKDSFLKAGVVFPFVRFCAPQNSQEKYAEPMNGVKKRSIEHKNHVGIGRFYARDRHYRTEAKKVFDEKNDTYEDKQYYSWEELIADDMRDIMEFNNSLHSNQKKYPGMTRWQVLEASMNPTLQPLDKSVWARFIGEHVVTSIRRNSYCRVAYTDWWLSDVSVIEKLAPNNWKVDAYYLTDEDGRVKEVYIYQNNMLIDRLKNIGTFNTADCEQTEEDKAIFVEQQKVISRFNKYVKENAITRVGIGVGSDQRCDEGITDLLASDPPTDLESELEDMCDYDYRAKAKEDY